MKAKENIIKALNPKWTMLFVLISFTSLMSSCVEGDLYDLYDEDISNYFPRKKQTKDIINANPHIPGATPANQPPSCALQTLIYISVYVLNFYPSDEVIQAAIVISGYEGIETLRTALKNIVGYYYGEDYVNSIINNNDGICYVHTISSITDREGHTFSSGDVVQTANYSTFFGDFLSGTHMFVICDPNTYVYESDFENAFLPIGSSMYEGPAVSSITDSSGLKYHKHWIEKYINCSELNILRNALYH